MISRYHGILIFSSTPPSFFLSRATSFGTPLDPASGPVRVLGPVQPPAYPACNFDYLVE